MLHLFKHPKTGKYDLALVVKGKYILGSVQHYNRKRGCYAAMRAILKNVGFGQPEFDVLYFQDDTLLKPEVFFISLKGGGIVAAAKMKPSKPYIPTASKKK